MRIYFDIFNYNTTQCRQDQIKGSVTLPQQQHIKINREINFNLYSIRINRA